MPLYQQIVRIPTVMRTDRVSIQESKLMTAKFLSTFNLVEVLDAFRQTRPPSVIIDQLKKNIKCLLLEIQGELVAVKQIQSLKVYDNINNTNIMESFLTLKQVLTTGKSEVKTEAAGDFLAYYRYKSQFAIITKYQAIDVPVEPITSKKKLAIYDCFMDYFDQHGLLVPKTCSKPAADYPSNHIESNTKIEGVTNGYTVDETHTIFKLFEMAEGRLPELQSRLRQSQYSEEKCSDKNIKALLVNCLTVGLARIYKISNNFDKFLGCSWRNFQQIHKKLMRSLSWKQKKLVLRVGIFNDAEDREVAILCNRIGIRYRPAGYPKWTKLGMPNPYSRQHSLVLQVIARQMDTIVKSARAGQEASKQ